MSVYPVTPDKPYGEATFGAQPRWPTLDRLMLVPPIHLPHRFAEIARLGREPLPPDVDTRVTIGGLRCALPLVVPAMGSTPVAHRNGIEVARAAAAEGVPLVLGENIATVHGYSKRRKDTMPSFKERLLAYLHAMGEDGGVVIQQSVEDAMDELWWQAYTDPDIEPFVGKGRVGFEIKVGQGAKPGLGGVTLLKPEDAESLKGEYRLGRKLPDGVERFSAPGTFTFEVLEAQVRHLRNDFPRARAWVKLPPTRDVLGMARAAASGGASLVTLDGAEGGTALAPNVFLEHVGLPALALLQQARSGRIACDAILSGGMRSGADIVKVRALGLQGVAMARTLLEEVQRGGAEGARERLQDLKQETQMLTYAMGHLSVQDLTEACVYSLDEPIARALGVPWVLDAPQEEGGGAPVASAAQRARGMAP